MRIFGYIRFSYLGRGDTRLSAASDRDPQGYLARLYAPDRMAQRFHIFETLTLPSLHHQSDPDFTVFVLASEVMPDAFKHRLEAAVADTPQVQVVYSNQETVLHAARQALKRAVADATEPAVHFRLDDDDGLGSDAIAALRDMGQRAVPETILSLPRGTVLMQLDGARYALPWYQDFIAIGWARVNAPGDLRPPFKFGHYRATRRFPFMADPRVNGYAYTLHPASDTQNRNHAKMTETLEAHRALLEPEPFSAHQAELAQSFPGHGYDGLLRVFDAA